MVIINICELRCDKWGNINKTLELIKNGGDGLLSKVLNTWQGMTKEEAEKYWKEGIGFEMAHYDSNMKMDKEINTKESYWRY